MYALFLQQLGCNGIMKSGYILVVTVPEIC